MDSEAFFQACWNDYSTIAPSAASIRDALTDRGEVVVNDHVAFRTFDLGPIALSKLEAPILALGYERAESYSFDAKKLRAFSYRSQTTAKAPKVFLSALCLDTFSDAFKKLVQRIVLQLPMDYSSSPGVFWSGRPWQAISWDEYIRLRAESEYAAWLAALGFHANHFTVFLNELSPALNRVDAMLDWVTARGFKVNEAGGRVKGGPAVFLEQGAILADMMPVEFADGDRNVPTCYYEFARRFETPDGALYQGFVTQNADRIFESTHSGTTGF